MPLSSEINSEKPPARDARESSKNSVSTAEIALDLGKSFLQSAVISPVCNGVGQIVSAGRLPQVSIVNEENAKRSEADAWAQKIGSAAGMAVDLFAMSLVAKRFVPHGAELNVEALSLGERSIHRASAGFKLGASYGAAFVPSQPDDNLILGRAKNALSNGVTFAFMSGLSEAAGGLSVLGKVRTGSLFHTAKEVAVTGVVGLPSGAVGAQVDSLVNHGRVASWKEVKEQATDYGVIGTVFASLTHGAAMGRPKAAVLSQGDPALGSLSARTVELSAAPVESASSVQLSSKAIDLRAGGDIADSSKRVASHSELMIDPRTLLAVERGKPISVEHFDTLASKGTKVIYADGTIATDFTSSNIKRTELADGTIITESDSGIRTDFPDGSEVNITAYRTEKRSADGTWTFESNHWTETWENWDSASVAQKVQALSTLAEIPRGGNLVANLVGKGLGDSSLSLQELAAKGIAKIPDAEELANQWILARDHNEHFAPQLVEMLPDLSADARRRLLSGSSYRIETILGDLSAKHDSLTSAEAEGRARNEYLDMLQDLSRGTRQRLWGFFGDVLDAKDDVRHRNGPLLQALARQVRQEGNDASSAGAARRAFGEFSDQTEARFRPLEKLQPGDVSRTDIEVKPAQHPEETLKQVQAMLTEAVARADRGEGVGALNVARAEASRLLEGSSSISLKKQFFDWAQEQPSDWIKRFADWQLSAPRRFVELSNEFIDLARKDPLSNFHDNLARSSAFDLSNRAAEYNISGAQVEATLQNSVQLMQIADANRGPSGELTRAGDQFRMAALQVMAQAADPYLIVQGNHPTCALAQLEFSTFMKHPDEASRLVNEILRTGKFVTTDGTTISVDAGSMRPESGSLEMNRTRYDQKDASYRSYASQIFQTGAANIHWQRQTIEPGSGRSVPAGSLRYEIHRIKNGHPAGTGGFTLEDRLVDYSQNPARVVADSPVIGRASQLTDIGHQIGGRRTEPSVTFNLPHDEASFAKYIESLPYPESFPLIVGIDADAMTNPALPFDRPNHAISIVSPFQAGRHIFFHNTWYPGGLVDNRLERSRFWSISWR